MIRKFFGKSTLVAISKAGVTTNGGSEEEPEKEQNFGD